MARVAEASKGGLRIRSRSLCLQPTPATHSAAEMVEYMPEVGKADAAGKGVRL
jgi:hypothetical protein